MALLQISEPGKSTLPHEHRRAVGIDLGTTNSLIASIISTQATIIENSENEKIVKALPLLGRALEKTKSLIQQIL